MSSRSSRCWSSAGASRTAASGAHGTQTCSAHRTRGIPSSMPQRDVRIVQRAGAARHAPCPSVPHAPASPPLHRRPVNRTRRGAAAALRWAVVAVWRMRSLDGRHVATVTRCAVGSEPALMAEIFSNYDCDVNQANLFEDLVRFLAAVCSSSTVLQHRCHTSYNARASAADKQCNARTVRRPRAPPVNCARLSFLCRLLHAVCCLISVACRLMSVA